MNETEALIMLMSVVTFIAIIVGIVLRKLIPRREMTPIEREAYEAEKGRIQAQNDYGRPVYEEDEEDEDDGPISTGLEPSPFFKAVFGRKNRGKKNNPFY